MQINVVHHIIVCNARVGLPRQLDFTVQNVWGDPHRRSSYAWIQPSSRTTTKAAPHTQCDDSHGCRLLYRWPNKHAPSA
jgi:hypothetical protein